MGGLALGIGIVIVVMVLVASAIGGTVGWLLLRRRAGAVGLVLGGAVGVGVGLLAVTATFFERTWSPPNELVLKAPAGFSHEWVYLVGDPTVDRDLQWSGGSLPFTRRVAALEVPRSGVVRLRHQFELQGWTEARLEVGGVFSAVDNGMSWSSLPPPGGRVVGFDFSEYPGTKFSPRDDPEALAARIAALESER